MSREGDMSKNKKKTSLSRSKSTEKGSISQVRIAVFGSGKVGKTSIIKRFLFNSFEEKYFETIEDIYKKVVFSNNQTVDLTIVDTAGNYQFPAMRELAIKQSDGFILAYAIDNVPSFHEVSRLRDIIVSIKKSQDVPILLVGNKTDAGFRRIQRIEASSTMKGWGSKVQHIETSAKNDINVDLLFNSLISMIDEQNNEKLEMTTFKDMSRYRLSSMRASVRNSTRRAKSFSFARKDKTPMINGRKTLQSIS